MTHTNLKLGQLKTGDLVLPVDAVERLEGADLSSWDGVHVAVRPSDIGQIHGDPVLIPMAGEHAAAPVGDVIAAFPGKAVIGVAQIQVSESATSPSEIARFLREVDLGETPSGWGADAADAPQAAYRALRRLVLGGTYTPTEVISRTCPYDGSTRPCSRHDY